MRLVSFCVVVVAIVCACLCGVDARWTELSAGGRDEPATSGTCGANVYWNYDQATHILSLTGSGDMDSSYAWQGEVPWDHLRSEIERVVVSEGITSIANLSFSECSSMTSIELPQSLTVIGHNAFWKCSKLTSINIPDTVTKIESLSFTGCSSLTTINIPECITSIGNQAFSGCSKLTSINIPDTVTKIEDLAFGGCSSLTTIKIPEGVTSIGILAFEGCSNLTSINIPDKVTRIEGSTFKDCSSLTTIKIPEGVTSIAGSAFSGCSKLTSINIPDAVTQIESYTFMDCSSLTAIIIPESVIQIGIRAFYGCTNLKSIGFYGTSITVITPMAPAAPDLFSTPKPFVCVPDEYNLTKFVDAEISRNSSSCSALYNKGVCDEAVFDVDKNEWVLVEKTSCKTTSPVFIESRSDRVQILVVMVYIMAFMFTIVLH